jgi:hypothetical protein
MYIVRFGHWEDDEAAVELESRDFIRCRDARASIESLQACEPDAAKGAVTCCDTVVVLEHALVLVSGSSLPRTWANFLSTGEWGKLDGEP